MYVKKSSRTNFLKNETLKKMFNNINKEMSKNGVSLMKT